MYLLVIAIIGVIAYDFWRIDSCLDSGGKWNAEKKICETELPVKKPIK
ncbi:MAG: hypothetical protein K2Q18_04810 [Bdellovibrionales bacterium]|nr:hypothetical protein [Bdellovibrionales bacterium]